MKVVPVVQTPPLCFLETRAEPTVPPAEQTFRPGYWLALMVGGYTGSGDYTRPPRDCRDTIARLERDGCEQDLPIDVLSGRMLTPSDLVVARVDDTHRLVWAMTDHLADGEAQGPVGLVEIQPKGLAVHALGTLRAYPGNASLRLETLNGSSILVADGEWCDAGQAGEECARAIRLMPLLGDRFVAKSLVDSDGACAGRSFIPVRGGGIISGGGAERRASYRVEALVTFSADAVVIREQLAIDRKPSHVAENARASYITRMQVDRQVTIRGGSLVVSSPSLLARWLSRQGREAGGGSYRP